MVEWEVVLFSALMFLATVRAITTAVTKTYDLRTSEPGDESERLVFLEDAEHWWTAVLINGLLLSIGIVQFLAPPLDPEVIRMFESLDLSWHYDYSTVISIIFAILLNIRIERHGYYFRKRNGINILGRPRQEGLLRSLKRPTRR